MVRVDHDNGKHDDMVQALGFAVTALLERPGGVGEFLIPTGDVHNAPIDRRAYKPPSEPPVPVVHEGEQRPVERLLSFPSATGPSELSRPRCSVTFLEAVPDFPAVLFNRGRRGSPTPCVGGRQGDLFFPTRGEPADDAKAVCAQCPVCQQCVEFALANGEKFGIWGGTSETWSAGLIRRHRGLSRRRASSAAASALVSERHSASCRHGGRRSPWPNSPMLSGLTAQRTRQASRRITPATGARWTSSGRKRRSACSPRGGPCGASWSARPGCGFNARADSYFERARCCDVTSETSDGLDGAGAAADR